jgi:tetratricopeptide (TPR) repeat protein
MKRRALLLAAAVAATAPACRRQDRASALADALLELSQRRAQTSPNELEWAKQELSRIAERVAQRYSSELSPARAITAVLFDELNFVREVESTRLDYVLLPGVLRSRRGSCVGLGCVYLCLAEALGFAAHGLLRPGHFYVRQEAPGAACNVELLRRGEPMPDGWYLARFPLTQPSSKSYGRALTQREVLGVTAFNIGNERRRQLELARAEAAYREAVTAFPNFAEAHASLGATEQLRGNAPAAVQSYARALELDPTLPGVENNLAILRVDVARQ